MCNLLSTDHDFSVFPAEIVKYKKNNLKRVLSHCFEYTHVLFTLCHLDIILGQFIITIAFSC